MNDGDSNGHHSSMLIIWGLGEFVIVMGTMDVDGHCWHCGDDEWTGMDKG
jgi:hypothetical protein